MQPKFRPLILIDEINPASDTEDKLKSDRVIMHHVGNRPTIGNPDMAGDDRPAKPVRNKIAVMHTGAPDHPGGRIRKAAHPGKLHASVAEPGDLHIDLKGPFPPSLCGKFQYAVIAIDQHTRYVFIAFIRNKSEAPEAVKKIIAEFNATVGTPTDEDGKPIMQIRHAGRVARGGVCGRAPAVARRDRARDGQCGRLRVRRAAAARGRGGVGPRALRNALARRVAAGAGRRLETTTRPRRPRPLGRARDAGAPAGGEERVPRRQHVRPRARDRVRLQVVADLSAS